MSIHTNSGNFALSTDRPFFFFQRGIDFERRIYLLRYLIFPQEIFPLSAGQPIPYSLLEVMKLQPEVAQLLEQDQPSGNRYIRDKAQAGLH